ncbi:thioredoxin, mitochondrial-like [Glandiceps talaboti]
MMATRVVCMTVLARSRRLLSSRNIPTTSAFLHTSSICRKSFNIQDTEDFTERVINSDTPTIVDFHASWCGPCKILGPRLEKVIAAKDGKVQLAKVDIDDNTDLAMEYGVSVVPTVIAMKKGDKVDEFVGVQDEVEVKSFVEKLL